MIAQLSRAWAVAMMVIGISRGAAAQSYAWQADATANVGVNSTSQEIPVQDPLAAPGDTRPETNSQMFTELRPGFLLQRSSPRVTWRLGGLFSGIINIDSQLSTAYTSQANLALAAIPSEATTVSLLASFAQGGEEFLIGQRAAETGNPMIRAAGNPQLLSLMVSQNLAWEIGPQWGMHQALIGQTIAEQGDFGAANSSVIGVLGVDRVDPRDAYGIELRGSASQLQSLAPGLPVQPYFSTANSVRARWNHDWSRQWNTLLTLGAAQVFTKTGSEPLALLPIGNVIARYTAGSMVGLADFTQDIGFNLQVGTVSLTDQLTARGIYTLDPTKARVIAFSLGVLHNSPIGSAGVMAVAATGTAIQGDVGYSTLLRKNMFATARYSIGYQFGLEGAAGPQLMHILLVGVTGTYSSGAAALRPVPTMGQRVDGADGQGFRVVDEPAIDEAAPDQGGEQKQQQ